MRESGKCEKCGSSDVIPQARVVSLGEGEHDLRIRVDAHPSALIFKESERSELEACICGQCGYTELYVREPRRLYDAYQRSQADE